MPGTVLTQRISRVAIRNSCTTASYRIRGRCNALPAALAFTILLLLNLQSPATRAQIVDKNQTQCCSSLAPEKPPATYYGATMIRNGDPRAAWKPYLAGPIDPPASVEELQKQIEEIELEGGPMAPALAEPLGWLGSAYMAEGREQLAIKHLSHAVHLLRINEGLYSPSQIGMLEQLIAAHIKLGDYTAADQQQTYLFRVQSFRQEHAGNDSLLEATLRYANWMRGVYLGDIDRARYPRLVGMNDLYEAAIEDLSETQGSNSPELLPYIQGRIELSYLISVYPGERVASFRAGAPRPTDYVGTDEAQLRFWRLRDHNFRYGLNALKHKEDIIREDPASKPQDLAQAIVARADWHQWHRQYAQAIRTYKEAWELVAEEADAQVWIQETFGSAMELPQETVFNPGVIPLGTLNVAEVSVAFEVTRHGEAKDINVLTEASDEDTQSAITRAYHYLRNVRFRPRLQDGEVVSSGKMQRTYQIRY